MTNQENQTNIRDFTLLYDYILVEALPTPASPDGLVKPDQYDDKEELGTVVSVGNGRLMADGTVLELHVKPGDIIMFNKYGTSKHRSEGKDYLLMREYDVVAVKHA
jgi:chaperonin GroES